MEFFKNHLSILNRINVLILRRLFNKRNKYKIKWSDNLSIRKNLILTPLQLIFEIYDNGKLNIVSVLLFVYCSLVLIHFLIVLFFIPKIGKPIFVPKRRYIEHKKKCFNFSCENSDWLKSVYFELNCLDNDKYIYGKNKVILYFNNFNPILKDNMGRIALNSLHYQNGGGKSEISEAWSIKILSSYFKVKNCIYEKQVCYTHKYKMVDFILETENEKIGISVTRAYSGRNLKDLIFKKIGGLIIARRIVDKTHKFSGAILHIFCRKNSKSELISAILDTDFENLIRGNLNILITESEYAPIFKY